MRKYQKYLVVSGLWLVFCGVPQWAVPQQEVLPEQNIVIGNKGQNIPVDLFDNIVYLEVLVNKKPLTFVLDTGAGDMSVIDVDQANRLKLPLQNRRVVSVGAGEEVVELYDVNDITLSLPSIEFLKQSLEGLPLSKRMDPFWGKKKDGLLGGNVLSRLVTVIDYVLNRVHFYEPSTFNYFGTGEKLPFTFRGLVPVVRVKLVLPGMTEPLEGLFLVDTGARTTTLAAPFVNEQKLLEKLPQKINTTSGYGIGGETHGVMGRVDKMLLGGIEIKKPVLEFSQDTKGVLANKDFSGILGADILHRFTVVFDYSRKQMILQKNKFFDDPFEYDMSGIFLKAEGVNFNQFLVFRVLENSPAAMAGVVVGDRILAIDDNKAATLTLEEIKNIFKTDGRKVQLHIQRDETVMSVTVLLKRGI